MGYGSFFAALLVALAYGNAQATQVVNEDDANYTVTIVTPEGEDTVYVAAGAVLDDVCPTGCTLILDESQVVATAYSSVRIFMSRLELDD